MQLVAQLQRHTQLVIQRQPYTILAAPLLRRTQRITTLHAALRRHTTQAAQRRRRIQRRVPQQQHTLPITTLLKVRLRRILRRGQQQPHIRLAIRQVILLQRLFLQAALQPQRILRRDLQLRRIKRATQLA